MEHNHDKGDYFSRRRSPRNQPPSASTATAASTSNPGFAGHDRAGDVDMDVDMDRVTDPDTVTDPDGDGGVEMNEQDQLDEEEINNGEQPFFAAARTRREAGQAPAFGQPSLTDPSRRPTRRTPSPLSRANAPYLSALHATETPPAANTLAPDSALASEMTRIMTHNRMLQNATREHEALISRQQVAIKNQAEELMRLRIHDAQTQPRILKLETQLSSTQAEFQQLQARELEARDNLVRVARARADVTKEADMLRSRVDTLAGQLTAQMSQLQVSQAADGGMVHGFGEHTKLQMRNQVLEAENAHLRADVVEGVERVRNLVQTQMEMGWELSESDRKAKEEQGQQRRKALEAAAMNNDVEAMAALGVRFRGESIWQVEDRKTEDRKAENGQAAQVSPSPLANLPNSLWLGRVEALDADTQVQSPIWPPVQGPSSPVRLRANSTTTTRLQTTLSVLKFQAMQQTTNLASTPLIPTLLMLFSALFLALNADRLAGERELWVKANGTARVLLTGLNGREWWSTSLGEWFTWKSEAWNRVEWPIMG